MSEGLAFIVFVVAPPALFGVGLLGSMALSWRRNRANHRDYVETRRLRDGLPPHVRCVCDECAAWRSVAANITRLQA